MRGFSNFSTRLVPEGPDRDYVIKSPKGKNRHNSLILDNNIKYICIKPLNISSFSQNSIPIVEKNEFDLEKV